MSKSPIEWHKTCLRNHIVNRNEMMVELDSSRKNWSVRPNRLISMPTRSRVPSRPA